MSKQTAVEWLNECLSIHLTDEQKMQFEGLFHQALAMEKDQIVESHLVGQEATIAYTTTGRNQTSLQYYNETYKGANNE